MAWRWSRSPACRSRRSTRRATDRCRHPGDSFSYDIFSQAGEAVRDPSGPSPLGDLKVKRVIAAGESQSAFRLVDYIDAIHPLAHVYDGFLVHSRVAISAPLSKRRSRRSAPATADHPRRPRRAGAHLRDRERRHSSATSPTVRPTRDTSVLWEVAGTSHYDYYGLVIGPDDIGNGEGAAKNLTAMQNPPTKIPGIVSFTCAKPINTGGAHWTLDDAIYSLNQWVTRGTPPPHGPLYANDPESPFVFARDANGIVRGGVRSPVVDAPIAALGGVGNTGAGPVGQYCFLFGTTVTFNNAKVATLYPTHSKFVSQTQQSAQQAVKGGFLRPADATELENAASASQIGG